jgi:hypothetical protein
MKLPCEQSIWYILPRIRADIARELVKEKMSQRDIAEKLGLTPAAVSQYLHKKRGGTRKTSDTYRKKINEAVVFMKKSDNEEKISEYICACCKLGNR